MHVNHKLSNVFISAEQIFEFTKAYNAIQMNKPQCKVTIGKGFFRPFFVDWVSFYFPKFKEFIRSTIPACQIRVAIYVCNSLE